MSLKENLKALMGAVRKPKTTADEVRSLLAQLEADIPAAETAVDDLEEKRRSLLRTGDDSEVDAIDAEIVIANRNVERLCALRDQSQERLALIEATDDQARRTKAYGEATALSSRMAPEVEKQFKECADGMVDALRKIHLVETVIRHANANLPEGEAPLPPFELTLRGIPGEPDERGKSRLLDPAWYYTGNAEAWGKVESQFVNNITPNKDGKTGKLNRAGSPFDVELRQYREVEILIGRGWTRPVPLALALSLPAFRAREPDIWSPFNHGFTDFGHNASIILDQIERLKQERLRQPSDTRPDRSTKTVLERVS